MSTNQSEQLGRLARALAKAQSEMQIAAKSAHNPHYNSNYSSLADVRAATIGPLNANGLSIDQIYIPLEPDKIIRVEHTEHKGGRELKFQVQSLCRLRTTLTHESGEFKASEIDIVAPWGDPHRVKSAMTIYRRAAWEAICGVASEDDDGNAAAGRNDAQRQPADRGQGGNRQRDNRNGYAPRDNRNNGYPARDNRQPSKPPPGPATKAPETTAAPPAETVPAALPAPAIAVPVPTGDVAPFNEFDNEPWDDTERPAGEAEDSERPTEAEAAAVDGEYTGADLFRWAKDHGHLPWFEAKGRKRGYPTKMIHWNASQVKEAAREWRLEQKTPSAAANGRH